MPREESFVGMCHGMRRSDWGRDHGHLPTRGIGFSSFRQRQLAGCAQSAGDGVDGQQQLWDELVGFFGLLHAMVAAPHFQ